VSVSHRTVEAAACGMGRCMWPVPSSGARSMVASTGVTGDAYVVDFGATKKGLFIVDACNVGLNFKPEEVGVSPPALIYKKKGKPMDEMFPAMENLVKILGEDDVGMVKLIFDGKTQVLQRFRTETQPGDTGIPARDPDFATIVCLNVYVRACMFFVCVFCLCLFLCVSVCLCVRACISERLRLRVCHVL